MTAHAMTFVCGLQRFVMYNHLNHDARLQIREICHPSEPKA